MSQQLKFLVILGLFVGLIVFLFFGLGGALGPLLLAFTLAYLFYPLSLKLEKKGISRSSAVLAIFFSLIVSILLILAVILPILVNEAKDFVESLPQILTKTLEYVDTLLLKIGIDVTISEATISSYLKANAAEFSKTYFQDIVSGLGSIAGGITSWLLAILNITLLPLFFLYLMNDYEKIVEGMKSFIPKSMRAIVNSYLLKIDRVLSGYIRGQLMVALSLGLMYSVGLSVIGLNFSLLIGLMSGLISIVPYAGFIIGIFLALSVAIANFESMTMIYGVVIVYSLAQAVESYILTPKLVGNKLGLSSLTTILAIVIGGNVFGLVGMLVAIPAAVILKSIFKDLKRIYQSLDIYNS